MSFRLVDVARDGHCFYRCVARLCKEDGDVADALDVTDPADEHASVLEIRKHVAESFVRDEKSAESYEALLKLYDEAEAGSDKRELAELFPLLEERHRREPGDAARDTNLRAAARAVADSNMMASSIEVDAVRRRLARISYDLLVLTRDTGADNRHTADKWLRDLHGLLRQAACARVATFVNEDNIHYKCLLYKGRHAASADDLRAHVQRLMDESDESDETDGA
jgi:hypothetical protein